MIPSILCFPRRGWENFIFKPELYLSFFSFSTNSKAAENIDFFLESPYNLIRYKMPRLKFGQETVVV